MNDKMKAKCYRLDYNELGLSTLCVEKDKEIKRLKEEYMMLQNASDEVEEEKDKEIEKLNTIIEIKTNRIQDLMSRLSKRQDRIDKAIECIDDELLVFGDETQWEDWEVRKYVFKALDILRGSDKK